MKILSICSTLFLALFLTGCSGIYRSYPVVKSGRQSAQAKAPQQEIVAEDAGLLLEETIEEHDLKAETQQEPELSLSSETTDASARIEKSTPTDYENDDTMYADPGKEEMVAEALASEKTATSALVFSFFPFGGIMFFPLFFVGLIGTLICLAKFRRYEFVSEKALRLKQRAVTTLIISTLVCVLVLLTIILIAVFVI